MQTLYREDNRQVHNNMGIIGQKSAKRGISETVSVLSGRQSKEPRKRGGTRTYHMHAYA